MGHRVNTRKPVPTDSEPQILENKSKGSNFTIESCVDESMVEVDESQIKWGRGFVENIDNVVAEFIIYRNICPLNVLFVCKEKNLFLADLLKKVCGELNMTFVTKRSLIDESVAWETVQNEELKEIFREINVRREQLIEEREIQTKPKESRKKKKPEPKHSLEETTSEGLISNEEVARIMRLKLESDFQMRMKGVSMFTICDDLRQFLHVYEEAFAKKMAYVVEINLSLMKIVDEDQSESGQIGRNNRQATRKTRERRSRGHSRKRRKNPAKRTWMKIL